MKTFTKLLSTFSILGFLVVSCIMPPPPSKATESTFVVPEVIETESATESRLQNEKKELEKQLNLLKDQRKEAEKKESQNLLSLNPTSPYYCPNKHVKTALKYHENGKQFFKNFMLKREQELLFYAWYAAEDSKYISGKVRKCRFKKDLHFYAIRNLNRMNFYLQKAVVNNLRSRGHIEYGELFYSDYRDIFPMDIR